MQEIQVPLNKGKLARLLIFSFLFVAGGLWLLISDPPLGIPAFDNAIFKTLFYYGSMIMGLYGIYFFSRKLFDKKLGIILNTEGIYDNTGAFRFGLIPWSDVSEVYERSVQANLFSKQHFITIGLTDPDKYISREKDPIKRKMLETNAESFGSPVHISTNGLETNHKDLMNLINDYFKRSKT